MVDYDGGFVSRPDFGVVALNLCKRRVGIIR